MVKALQKPHAEAKARIPSVVLAGQAGGDRQRIVVGVDGSPASKHALRWAARQAQLTGAMLEAVMTWEAPVTPYGIWDGYDNGLQTQKALEEVVHEVLGGTEVLINGVGEIDGLKVVATAVPGRPATVLLEESEGAELLVIGSRGLGAFAGMFLGSVSEHCIAHAPCPVVVVRHSSEAT